MTNLEIDDGLVARLEAAAKARGLSTREFVEETLREAAAALPEAAAPAKFEQRIHDFGTHIESPWTVLVDLEGEEYMRKHTRK